MADWRPTVILAGLIIVGGLVAMVLSILGSQEPSPPAFHLAGQA